MINISYTDIFPFQSRDQEPEGTTPGPWQQTLLRSLTTHLPLALPLSEFNLVNLHLDWAHFTWVPYVTECSRPLTRHQRAQVVRFTPTLTISLPTALSIYHSCKRPSTTLEIPQEDLKTRRAEEENTNRPAGRRRGGI